MTTQFMAHRPPVVALVGLLLALLAISPLVSGKLPQKIELQRASFTLSAVLAIKQNNTLNGYYKLREFHSAWQSRSRIDFEAAGIGWAFSNSRGTFFADDTRAFKVDRIFNRCANVEQANINAALKMEFTGALDEPPHVIGTVRLLHFIEQHSDQFGPVAPVDGGVGGGAEFAAKLQGLSISVLYGEHSSSLPLGVPSRVVVVRPDGTTLMLRPMRVTLLAPRELVLGDSSLPPGARQATLADQDLLFDVFAVDRDLACSRYAREDVEMSDALAAANHAYRFTFWSHVSSERNSPLPVPTVVGYEPALETLRVSQRFQRFSFQTWVSYQHDRVYSVIGRNGGERGGYSKINTILDLGQDADANGDDEDRSISCVVAKASLGTRLTDTFGNPHSLGAMLLGASKVVYLGLARVRGIEAHVYEAHDSQMPAWLEHPAVYAEAGKEALKWRTNAPVDEKSRMIFNTVFYVSRAQSGDGGGSSNRLLGGKLLLIEIFKTSLLGVQLDKITIPVFEFAWELQTVAPDGQRTEDFFSLGDECLSPAGENNHYARIGLNLKAAPREETDGPDEPNWLRTPVKRNLALMRAVHEQFGVPPPLVYDFESRQQQAADLVSASMLAAERQEAPVSLVYLGRATPVFPQFNVVAVSGFQVCYQLASHKRRDTFFAYNAIMATCYVYRRAVADDHDETRDSRGKIYKPEPASSYEMYKILHRPSRKLAHDDYITKLDEMQARLVSAGRVILTEPEGRAQKAHFSLAQVQVDHLNEKTAYDLDEHHLDDINKFPGLGLLTEDPQNKLIEPKRDDGASQQVAAMTFEQCHEACLIDVECESFSTCIVAGRVQCVLSSVDFKLSTVVLQLMEFRDQKSKLGATFSISLDGERVPQGGGSDSFDLGTVRVRKHPTCELHNKLYRDLFRDAGESAVSLRGDRLLRPVTHPEQCAEFCYLGTLATMRKETRRLRKTVHGAELDPGLTEGYSAGHCGHYFYLSQQTIASARVQIPKEQIISMHTDGATRGYCLFDDGSDEPIVRRGQKSPPAGAKGTASAQSLQLHKFELDFSVMYEKEYGVALLESEKSPEEKRAYLKIYLERDYSRANLDLMREFIERGGNSGHRARMASAQECARQCFTQLTPLWPACRSFEHYQIVEKNTARRHSFCTFNTATVNQLTDLGRTDMLARAGGNKNNGEQRPERVHVNEGDEVRVWHYEPRQGLVASSLRERYLVSMDETERELNEHVKSLPSFYFSSLGFLFMVCVFFTAGIGAGVWLQARTLNRASEDNEILVERATDLNLDDRAEDEQLPVHSAANGTTHVQVE